MERSSVSSLSKHGGGGGSVGGGGGGGLCGEYTQMWELRRSQPLSTHTVISTDSGLDTASVACTAPLTGGGGGGAPACCSSVKTNFSTFKPSNECPYERPHLVAMEAMLAASQNHDHVPYYFEYEPPLEDESGGVTVGGGGGGGGGGVLGLGGSADSRDGKRPDLLSNSNRKNASSTAPASEVGSGAKPDAATLRRVPCQKTNGSGPRDVCDHCAMHPCIDKALEESTINVQAQSL